MNHIRKILQHLIIILCAAFVIIFSIRDAGQSPESEAEVLEAHRLAEEIRLQELAAQEAAEAAQSETYQVQEIGESDNSDEESEELPTKLQFLQTAILPVGSTMYVWGGGWNEEDTGAGEDATTIGVSPRWAEFAAEQDATYNDDYTRYQIHDGLDCSGFIGWAVYNTLETENGLEGYVYKSSSIAGHFASRGMGDFIAAENLDGWECGDIFCMEGHTGIIVGTCEDGSVLILHASPPGLAFAGTRLVTGEDSEAIHIAETIMSEMYPDWYARYPKCLVPSGYLAKAYAFRWDEDVLSDPEGLTDLSASAIVSKLYPDLGPDAE